ncbi:NACHT domain-containing protein, partial [bacterium]|nr:NACHT domain-containing protein [bacterium]
MSKRFTLDKNTPLESFAFLKDDEKTILINGCINLIFKSPYHFKIVKLIWEAMQKSNGKVSKTQIEDIVKYDAYIPNEKSFKDFNSFYKNAWCKGFTKGHTNNWYFEVKVNGRTIGSIKGEDKNLKTIDFKRREFLEKVFDHEGMQFFWLGPKDYIKHYWILEYKKRLLEDLKNDEDIHEKRFIELKTEEKKEQSLQKSLKEQINEQISFQEILKETKDNPQLILLGECGSGKTTTLKYYLKQHAEKINPKNPNSKIPVFIPLKRFKEEQQKHISSFVVSSINYHLEKKIDEESIDINKDCVLLFDGLDEISNPGLKTTAILQLKDLLLKIENVAIVSCRSRNYQNNFSVYPCYELKELGNEQIQKYLTSFFKKEAAKIFKTKIENDPNILGIARNPFLLYIIAKTLEENPDMPLPKNKGALIENFVEKICLEKNKDLIDIPSVPKHTKHRLLGMFAYRMLKESVEGGITCSSETRNKIEDEWLEKQRLEPSKILLLAEKERLLKSGSTE